MNNEDAKKSNRLSPISNGMKKTILFSIFFLFFGLAPHVFAEGFVALAPIPGLTQGATADTAGLANFFNNLYKFAIGMASVLAVIMIIWGGLQYATQDIPGAKQEGKDRILQAILGLVLVLSPVLVFSIINPSILNLSINLPALDTRSGSYQPRPITTPATLSDTEKRTRESGGGAVESAFTLPATDMRSLGRILDAKQIECTQKTGGLGVVLPAPTTGGGEFNYVCQTCPPNTLPTLFAPGKVGSSARGACQPK